ncbi:hypothetical protein [Blastococcus deserti]|uniref:Uncharacterized protein n=1 Tax=Blastococcus deserti TaxID=2259033 RepID=A0ABW4XEE8_9ACTN
MIRSAVRSAVRDLVDEVAVGCGFAVPAWYRRLEAVAVPRVGSRTAMRAAALDAGFTGISVEERTVDVGVGTAADLVDYRFGQGHYAA